MRRLPPTYTVHRAERVLFRRAAWCALALGLALILVGSLGLGQGGEPLWPMAGVGAPYLAGGVWALTRIRYRDADGTDARMGGDRRQGS